MIRQMFQLFFKRLSLHDFSADRQVVKEMSGLIIDGLNFRFEPNPALISMKMTKLKGQGDVFFLHFFQLLPDDLDVVRMDIVERILPFVISGRKAEQGTVRRGCIANGTIPL